MLIVVPCSLPFPPKNKLNKKMEGEKLISITLVFVLMCYSWSSVQALEVFRKQQVDFLIATDVAARVR